ncbi:protein MICRORCHIDIA 6-like isoform X1 [Canna indica]|uniref:Protein MICRORCHIDIA 6-like isoform X1 n=1 Tax=Canna indica TaxID=4628 RepID=A0AAQ3JL33_9LILI|nr:protein MICRORCHIDIA 6-like isoform X1 [Canna indica]
MSMPNLRSGGQMNTQVMIDHKPCAVSIVGQEKTANHQLTSPNSATSQGFVESRNMQISNRFPNQFVIAGQSSSSDGYIPVDHFCGPRALPSRKFWSAGVYEVEPTIRPPSHNNQNRLCVHPKFLHSNATSHKWAFGAVAELLDNAVDEIRNGATFVNLDKITNPLDGSPALLIQDDGGGMDPESLRCCMSFGFSDKGSCSAIGQYGNGFKTSTMRLGADVIVFSRHIKRSMSTLSVALLSYTYLIQEGYNDIVVPAVDYAMDPSNGIVTKLLRNGEKQFFSNLSFLLKWSPFRTENELLKNFDDIGHHGTRIIIYNLWFNDMGVRELDFETNEKDIMLSGAPKQVESNSISVKLTQKHIANRLRYSLQVYLSILYLHLPEDFTIILRGCEVKRHTIASDLRYCECIKYCPQVGGKTEGEVVTTIGFLKEAPFVNVHGFNIYHRKRLILPFWRVASASGSRGRGVVGVLQADFIKPTHDKQDFEKSALYQKLECRLKEMTYEYWENYCHVLGYRKNTPRLIPPAAIIPLPPPASSGNNMKTIPINPEFSLYTIEHSDRLACTPAMGLYPSSKKSSPGELYTVQTSNSIGGRSEQAELIAECEPLKRRKMCGTVMEEEQSSYPSELVNCVRQKQVEETKALIQENKDLDKEKSSTQIEEEYESMTVEVGSTYQHPSKMCKKIVADEVFDIVSSGDPLSKVTDRIDSAVKSVMDKNKKDEFIFLAYYESWKSKIFTQFAFPPVLVPLTTKEYDL